jgi:FeS assembly SUF system protein
MDSDAKDIRLNVLPSSGKVEQMRQEIEQQGSGTGSQPASSPKNFADRNVIDRAVDATKTPRQKAIEERVIEALRSVYDPEIPVNIYDLGLIYEIKVDDQSGAVEVRMTLTAPGCPVAGSLPPEVERKIEVIPEVSSAKVELVWDPPWSRERMSEAAMLQLGFL